MARRARQRKRVLILLGAVALLAVAGVVAVQVRAQQEARRIADARAEGLAASAEGRHTDAVRELSYVVSKTKGDGEAMLALATSRRQIPEVNGRHLATALAFAAAAAEAMADDLRPLRLELSLYSELGRLTERLDTAHAILSIDPSDYEAMLVEVDSLSRLGRRDEALDRALALRRAHPAQPDAVRAVVDLMLQTDRPDEAVLAFLDEAIAADPGDARLALVRVRALGQLNRLDEARAAALAVADLDLPDAESLAEAVQLLDLLGESTSADRLLGRAREGSAGDQAVTVVAAARDWRNARFDSALGQVTAALTDPATAGDALLGWAAIIGDRDAPGPLARAALAERESTEARAWTATLAARDAVRAGDWARAAASARRALELDPANTVAVFLLGESERGSGDWRAATTRWNDLIRREPRWLTLRLDLASALLAANQTADAFDVAVQALRQWPTSLIAAIGAGRAGVSLVESGAADKDQRLRVTDLVTALVDQAGDTPAVTALDVRLRAVSGDQDGARAALARLLDAPALPAPVDLVPLINACRSAEIFGVDELVARAVADSAPSPETVLAAALALHDAGRIADARAMIDTAIADSSGDPTEALALRRVRATFLDRIGDSGAREALAALSRDHPDNAAVILAVLGSRSAWTDRNLIDSSVTALRDITGEDSSVWKVFQARAGLTFGGGDEAAANAVRTLEPVIRREPTNTAALAILAEAYASLRDYPRAAEMMSRAVNAQPPRFDLLARLIELLQTAGQRDRAGARLTEALAMTDLSRDERRQRARLLLRQGAATEALPDIRAIAAETGSVADASLAAEVAQRAGAVDEARAAFRAILDRPDRTAEAVRTAADFLALNDGFDAGLDALSRLPDTLPAEDRAMVEALFFGRHGRTDDAIERLDALAQSSGRADAFSALAQLRLDQGDTSGAEAAVAAGLTRHPDDPALLALRDHLAFRDGLDSPEALRSVLARLGDKAPERQAIERYAAALEAIQARPDDADFAADQFRRLTEQFPTFLPAWEQLATVLSNAGRAEEAATVAREAAARIPGSADAARLAARALALAERYDEALAMAEQWRRRLTGDPYPAVLFSASLQRQLGRDPEALSLLDSWRSRVVTEADENPPVMMALAELLVKAGREDEAAALFDPLVARDESWAIRRLGLASDLIAAPARARAWIEQWESAAPDTPDADFVRGQVWYELATVLGNRDLVRRALEPLARAAQSPDQALPASLFLGGAYEQLDDPAGAEGAYRAALALDPDQPDALNNLAFLLVRTGGDAAEAVSLARRAVRAVDTREVSSSQRANILDTLGAALAAAGSPADAADAYEQALRLTPEAPGILLGLAEARLDAGQAPGDALDRLRALRDHGRLTSGEQRQRLAVILERAGGG